MMQALRFGRTPDAAEERSGAALDEDAEERRRALVDEADAEDESCAEPRQALRARSRRPLDVACVVGPSIADARAVLVILLASFLSALTQGRNSAFGVVWLATAPAVGSG